jgi:flagellar biogenesis protein FliO
MRIKRDNPITTHFVAVRVVALFAAVLAASHLDARAEAAPAQDRPLFRNGTVPPSAQVAVRGDGDAGQRDAGHGDAGQLQSGPEPKSLGSAGSSSFAKELLPTGAALGATLLAIVLARSAVKRFGGKFASAGRPQGVVEVLARYPVARGQHIVLLKVGRRVIVTHQSAQGMKTLSEFSGEAEVADLIGRCEAGARASSPFSFDALLRQSGKSIDAHEQAAGSDARAVAAAPRGRRADPRDALPALMRDAEIETVDLTRARRPGGAR